MGSYDSSAALRMSQKKGDTKSEQAGYCDVVAEPSPTGRDAAGLLSRKVTGEVRFDRIDASPWNLRAKCRPRHFALSISSSLRCRGYPCPGKCETHGGFHIQLRSSWLRPRFLPAIPS